MSSVSVVIITLNEEANISACLDSADWADEIIVLDSGSTDRTLEICREKGIETHYQAWAGYSGQKNAACALATGDWILSLDADERVTPELASEIRKIAAENSGDIDGYFVLRKVFYRNKWLRHGGFYPEKVLRFFRASKGNFAERAVHEVIKVEGRTAMINQDLEHYTYTGVSDYLDRMQKYSTLSAEEYYINGRKTGPLRMLGRAFFTFFQMYFLKRGFLDGYEGFLMAVLYGFYTFVKYAKLRELNRGEAS